jgi:hypothetical protein
LPIALDQTSNLVGGVDKAVLALGATGDSIVGDAADDVLTGAAVGSGVGLGGGAVDADGGLGGLRAGLGIGWDLSNPLGDQKRLELSKI